MSDNNQQIQQQDHVHVLWCDW